MKPIVTSLIAGLCAGVLTAGAYLYEHEAPSIGPVRGRYVEARSAAVFAGACHFNGEVGSQGRDAILGWHLVDGSWDGVALAGVDIVAAVTSSENLRDGAARTSVVYLDASLDDETRSAAEGWLRARQPETVGEILTVRDTDVHVSTADGNFVLVAGDRIELVGETLPDRSCCKIPESVWYEPLASGLGQPLVGNASVCRFAGDLALPAWSHTDQNNVFVSCFRETCCDAGPCEGAPAAAE
ncbi:MAG: DUF1326 domain-containing protein [Planctomycetes bacterium]|nr:DUF1326 domain-containing protein [Planctomycetota bacterium]